MCDLVDRIAADPAFRMTKEEILSELAPTRFIGRCPSQVTDFLREQVQPLLDRYGKEEIVAELSV